MSRNVLVIGSEGQIGTELCLALEKIEGNRVFRADIRLQTDPSLNRYRLDVTDRPSLRQLILSEPFEEVYLMAAVLSASGEKNPTAAWDINMNSLIDLLELGKNGAYQRLFWPSSIAVFGPNSPKINTPQECIMDPTTIYGISKRSGEYWCSYYARKHGVDVRSIRYPGLISFGAEPGGGTTDYAVDIFKHAKRNITYTCYLHPETTLPMLFMADAIAATLNLMQIPKHEVRVRTSYNLGGFATSPELLGASIRRHIPDFQLNYHIDFRQEIADSWPESIDDLFAQQDFKFYRSQDLDQTVDLMLQGIQ